MSWSRHQILLGSAGRGGAWGGLDLRYLILTRRHRHLLQSDWQRPRKDTMWIDGCVLRGRVACQQQHADRALCCAAQLSHLPVAELCSNWPQPLFQLTKPSTLYSLYYTRLTPDSSCLLTNNVQSQSSDLFRLHCKISRLFRNRSHFMLNLHMCCKKGHSRSRQSNATALLFHLLAPRWVKY